VASLTAARLGDGPPETGALAGRGLRDVTRIAAGDPALWADIVRANAPALAGVLRGLHADLSGLLAAVETLAGSGSGDRVAAERAVTDVLSRGAAGVAVAEPAFTGTRLRVRLRRGPGELSRLLAAAAGFGVVADGVTAELEAGGELVVRCGVPAAMAALAVARLRAAGWDIAPEDRHSDSAQNVSRTNVELSNVAANSGPSAS
jgi:prephenate dehydrogenase